MLAGILPTFEIRYAKPPHAVGFDRIVRDDEFDAQIYGEDTYGADLLDVRELVRGDWSHVEAHDKLLLNAGPAPGWLKKIGVAIDSTIDGVLARKR